MRLLVLLSLASASLAQLIDPMCRKPADTEVNEVFLKPWDVSIDQWLPEVKQYVTRGKTTTKVLAQSKGDFESDHAFGISVHAANVYGGKHDPNTNKYLPPVYFGASFKNTFYHLSDVLFEDINTPNKTSGNLKVHGYGLGPSGIWNVEDKEGNFAGQLIGGGNPFRINRDPETGETIRSKGSVAFLPKDPSESCPMLFPEADVDDKGKVVNTVYCHKPTGVCFFSVWKFLTRTERLDPDCLWWCIPDDLSNPTSCLSEDILTYENGRTKVCNTKIEEGTHYGGGVHGFTLGNTDPSDPSIFDLILIFTGGPEIEGPGGVSHMKKITVQRRGDSVVTLKVEEFGSQLWQDTVELPYDAGLDHGFLEEGGEYLWISSFREKNPGIHMVDYSTGELIYSLHGFNGSVADQYTYPSGVHGFGRAGQKGSFLVLTTSTLKGLQPFIPRPCGFNFECGVGPVYLVDISGIVPPKRRSPKATP